MKPQKAAKQFVWSDGVKGVYAGPEFFETYGWDSDERMHVNEVASYYETFAMAWQRGFVDEELVLDWVPATLYWGLIGPILLAARDMPNPRSQQRSVIVPGCLPSNLDRSCWQHNTHPLQHRGHAGAVIANSAGPNNR